MYKNYNKHNLVIVYWVLFLILKFLATTVAAQNILDNPFYIYPITAQYDSLLQSRIVEYDIPGAACAIVSQDETVYMQCFGVRDIRETIPVDEHTLFRLASLSKAFTAILTGVLVDEGALAWDERVIHYLPDFKLMNSEYTEQLTIRHLLSHTSGLPSYAGTELLENNLSYNELYNIIQQVPPLARPGQQYNYQNVVFSIVGDIMTSVMDTSYKALVNSMLFKPLEMQDATIGRQDFITSSNHASPHVLINSVQTPVEVKPSYYRIAPAAGINASIDDMAKWLKVILGYRPEIISRSTLQQATEPFTETEKATRYFGKWQLLGNAAYGLGWRIFDYAGNRLVYHGGSVQGFRAEIAVFPAYQLGIVFLFNCETPFADFCVPEFLNLYLSLISENYTLTTTLQ